MTIPPDARSIAETLTQYVEKLQLQDRLWRAQTLTANAVDDENGAAYAEGNSAGFRCALNLLLPLRAAASRVTQEPPQEAGQTERGVERFDSDRPDYPSHPLPCLSHGDPRLSESIGGHWHWIPEPPAAPSSPAAPPEETFTTSPINTDGQDYLVQSDADGNVIATPLAPPVTGGRQPSLGKGVDPHYFVTLADMHRTTDDWIEFTFHEGGVIRVPIHADNVAVLIEPERH